MLVHFHTTGLRYSTDLIAQDVSIFVRKPRWAVASITRPPSRDLPRAIEELYPSLFIEEPRGGFLAIGTLLQHRLRQIVGPLLEYSRGASWGPFQ